MKKNIILPITIQNDVITVLSKAYPLCILFGKEGIKNWYCSKFIRVVGNIWEDGSSDFDLIDWCGSSDQYIDGVMQEWFEEKHYPTNKFHNSKDFFEFLRYAFLQKQYCVVFVDEFYINVSKRYLSEHFMHEYLIYGLDYQKECVLVVGFNRKGYLDNLQISFVDLFAGMIHFDENKRADLPVKNTQIIGLTVKKEIPFLSIDINELAREIKSYISSEYSKNDLDLVTTKYNGQFFWGVETYFLLQYHIMNVGRNKEKQNFRLVHFFYEHKKGIEAKIMMLKMILPLNNIDYKYNRDVIKPIQQIRMHYLKDILSHKNTFEEKKLQLELNTIKQNEISLLEELYKCIIKEKKI